MKRPAFSIAEMMITLTIFSVISAISVSVLYNANRAAKAVQSQVFLYTEAQALMDQIARVVERNTVDYEAYYLKLVETEPGWGAENYGYYAQRFINPGSAGGPETDGPYPSVTGYGTYCAGSTSTYPDSGCSLPDYASSDTDEGKNPYTTSIGAVEESNAFCDTSTDCGLFENQVLDYLILINAEGDERTILAQENFTTGSSDKYLSKIVLTGTDTTGDGIENDWNCSSRYTCTTSSGTLPHRDDLTRTTNGELSAGAQQDFMPISPSTLTIQEFHVIIGPVEDPYRAFAEPEVQIQPQVTIVMTVTLSEDYGASSIGTPPSVTFQRTISTGVYSEVLSYD